MISRYALYDTATISNHYNLTEGLPKGIKPNYNISPTAKSAVIVSDGNLRTGKLMQWGLVPQGAKDTNSVFRYKTHNISSEKIFKKHSWEKLVLHTRCLVQANGYYDLSESGEKRAHYVQSSDASLLAFAGVYSTWQDPEGRERGMYSVITIDANPDMPHYNDRMPVIITPENYERWLDPTVTDHSAVYDMLRPHPSAYLRVCQVGSGVYSAKQKSSSLMNLI